MKFESLIFAMGIGMTLAACGGSDDDVTVEPTAAVPPPPPESAIATFALTPENPAAGETFAATFSQDHDRGGFFLLSLWNGQAWDDPAFLLESDANQGSPTVEVISDEFGWEDYGISGPGPDGLVMPDELTDGYWRLCTANARDDACTQLDVGLGVPADDSAEPVDASPLATTAEGATTGDSDRTPFTEFEAYQLTYTSTCGDGPFIALDPTEIVVRGGSLTVLNGDQPAPWIAGSIEVWNQLLAEVPDNEEVIVVRGDEGEPIRLQIGPEESMDNSFCVNVLNFETL